MAPKEPANFRTAAARIVDKVMDKNELEQVVTRVAAGLNGRMGLLVTSLRASSLKLDRVSQGGVVH